MGLCGAAGASSEGGRPDDLIVDPDAFIGSYGYPAFFTAMVVEEFVPSMPRGVPFSSGLGH
jgi:hypothetical protein